MKNTGILSPIGILLAFVVLVGLAGCAGPPLVEARKAGITMVVVEPRVTIQRPMQYGARLKNYQGGLAAALADMTTTAMTKGKSRTVSEMVQEAGVDVPQL